MFKGILDKFRLAGGQSGGLFHLDKELESMIGAVDPSGQNPA